MNKWQPIETAPKDGTRILAFSSESCDNCNPMSPRMSVAHWREGRWSGGRFATGDYVHFTHQPSHWMPLPPPPSAGEQP